MRIGLCLLAFTLFGVLSAPADIIYDNGSPDGSNTWFHYSDGGSPTLRYDNFFLTPGANVIRDIHWYGAYSGAPMEQDDFHIGIYTFLEWYPGEWGFFSVFGAHPGHVTRTYTGIIGDDGLGIWEYSLNIPPLELEAGPTYWMTIFNTTSGFDTLWGWSAVADGGHMYFVDMGYGEVNVFEYQDLAFRLTNDVVPEPATMGLLALGLSGLAFRYRKKASVRQ